MQQDSQHLAPTHGVPNRIEQIMMRTGFNTRSDPARVPSNAIEEGFVQSIYVNQQHVQWTDSLQSGVSERPDKTCISGQASKHALPITGGLVVNHWQRG